jgi:hypothetical protein
LDASNTAAASTSFLDPVVVMGLLPDRVHVKCNCNIDRGGRNAGAAEKTLDNA